jgi:hypothetical protein
VLAHGCSSSRPGAEASRAPYFNGGAYVNYCDQDLPNWVQAYFGRHFDRLRRVKAAYDPECFFNTGPQSILPG